MIDTLLIVGITFLFLLSYPIIVTIFCAILLISVAIWWKIAGYGILFIDWFCVKFSQATSLGGWCLATVAVAFGLCTWESFKDNKEKEKD